MKSSMFSRTILRLLETRLQRVLTTIAPSMPSLANSLIKLRSLQTKQLHALSSIPKSPLLWLWALSRIYPLMIELKSAANLSSLRFSFLTSRTVRLFLLNSHFKLTLKSRQLSSPPKTPRLSSVVASMVSWFLGIVAQPSMSLLKAAKHRRTMMRLPRI